MGYKRVKMGENDTNYAIISTPEKKRGNGEKKNLKFHVFFVKHKFCKNKNNINKYYIIYNI